MIQRNDFKLLSEGNLPKNYSFPILLLLDSLKQKVTLGYYNGEIFTDYSGAPLNKESVIGFVEVYNRDEIPYKVALELSEYREDDIIGKDLLPSLKDSDVSNPCLVFNKKFCCKIVKYSFVYRRWLDLSGIGEVKYFVEIAV